MQPETLPRLVSTFCFSADYDSHRCVGSACLGHYEFLRHLPMRMFACTATTLHGHYEPRLNSEFVLNLLNTLNFASEPHPAFGPSCTLLPCPSKKDGVLVRS